MKGLGEKIAAGEPLRQQALQAWREYEDAKGILPAEEVERLRVEAESLMAAVQQYQFRVLGGPAQTLH
ncbi:hypothetical protein [Pseudomonas sp. R5(2019)]|uniref:hypothetical protein n=1 Tax=Pseudomonas sp. R5(2019) TaxID=2697566 RepID=UPI00141347B3|nr:hypothetical protein [Pseudomonas sp. R5(2019)]NBA95494.1 hypothetical protein [Pseudomonas sp. R5(2019)]